MVTRLIALIAAFALTFSAASAYPISASHTYIDGETLTAAIMNPNLQTIYSWANGGIDNTNIGSSGIFASQIKPSSTATATFGGGWGWVVTTSTNSQVALTVTSPASPSVDILDVFKSATKAFWIDSNGVVNVGSGGLYAQPTINSTNTAGPVAPAYNASGAAKASTFHGVCDTFTGIGGTQSITLTGAAVFSSQTSYAISGHSRTNGNPITLPNPDTSTGSHIDFNTIGSQVYTFCAWGT